MTGFGERIASGDLHDGSIKPMAAVSLAISVAATGLLLHQGSSQVAAAESQGIRNKLFDAQASLGTSPSFQASADSLTIYRPVTVARASDATGAPSPSVDSSASHVVREGETLWSIAQLYGLSDVALAQLNDLPTGHVLQIGQILNVPESRQNSASQIAQSHPEVIDTGSDPASRNLAQLQVRDISLNALKVSSDEALSSSTLRSPIGSGTSTDAASIREEAVARLRLRREELRASLSGVRSEALISPPSADETESSRSSAEIVRGLSSSSHRTGDLQAVRESVSPSNATSSYITYEIQRGDTLAAVARDHGVSLSAVLQANPISNPNRIFVGQSIRIPAQVESQSLPGDVAVKAGAPVGLSGSTGSTNEVLVSALPSIQFGTTSSLPTFRSAPVVPLPVSSLDDSEEEVEIEPHNSVSENVNEPSVETVDVAALGGDRTEEATAQSASETVSETYVEELIQDFEEISRTEQSVARRSLLDELDQLSQRGVGSSSYRPDIAYIEERNAVNPEFIAEATQEDSVDPIELVDDPSTRTRSEESLVAVAPLGAQNYSPIAQPATGRIVSPDLPPLPGAENYIPSSEATFNGYLWPARGVLTSGYGWRWGRMHQGIDIAAPVGTPIYAAAPGVVEFSGWNSGGYGNMVDIRHPDGSKTRYAHNSRNLVRVGQRVAQGHQIAEMGSTGYSTGPHVHFEIHHSERGVVNPVAFLPRR
ncbi:MAG: peptidoglycan DD-metalloendopeptidase family protein [Leptolyngbyaceae bacterium]|nr:peptidoglycan DD-metalloendopeptidase family protein [Leptolyngbyaceae bacterium]